MGRQLVIIVFVIALVFLGLGYTVASTSTAPRGYRVLVTLWTNISTGPGELGRPLNALTKVDCGESIAVVYGYESGRPLLVVVYYNTASPEKALKDALACPKSLKPCLSAAGYGYMADKLWKEIMRLANESSKHPAPVAVETGRPCPARRGFETYALPSLALLAGLGLGYAIARMRPRWRQAAS